MMGWNREFDALGNRLSPFEGDMAPTEVNPHLNYRGPTHDDPLGLNSRVSYERILAIPTNPYNLKPTSTPLKQLGPYDLQYPSTMLGFQHESALQVVRGSEPISDFSFDLESRLQMTPAPERASQVDLILSYEIEKKNYLETTELNTINHQGFVVLHFPFSRGSLMS